MVNLGVSRVDDAVASKHPGLQNYAACQSRAFMMGIGSFIIGAAGMLAIQAVLRKKLVYAPQWSVLISGVTAAVGSHVVTSKETQKCSDLWLLLETGKVPERFPPQQPQTDEAHTPGKTKYGDVMD